jgi:CheY-like chemotaxis protein
MLNANEKDVLKNKTKITVLIADDDPIARLLYQHYLETLNCSVITAANGAEAIAAFNAQKPDFIFTDVQMPNMNGFELAREIRKQETSGHLPIVAITSSEDGIAGKCQSAGIDDFLIKPMILDELRKILELHLPIVLRYLLQKKINNDDADK